MNAQKHFAPVVPLDIARFLNNEGHLGKYHLLLAHDVLEHPEEYKEIYGNSVNRAPMEIMMDNSLIELGYPMQVRQVIEAARIVGAQKIVLPDVLDDLKKTLSLVYEAVEIFRRLPLDVTAGLKMVGVVQGNNIYECRTCLDEYRRMGLDISIPRVLVEILGTRSEIIQTAFFLGFRNMHLLGFSDNMIDDVACTRMPGVKGIDSAVPIRAGAKNIHLSLDNLDCSTSIGPRGDFWNLREEHLGMESRVAILENVRTYRYWINA